MRRDRMLVGALAAAMIGAATLDAQRGFGGNSTVVNNVSYDGRFTYARLQYTPAFMARDPMWNHDYPRSDRIFPQILAELTSMRARWDGSNVFRADDPELMKFPMVYLCEVGAWRPSDAEVAGLRRYMMKGGFVLVDDFDGPAWDNFVVHLGRILPEARPIRLDPSHPIYDSFYRIADLSFAEEGGAFGPEFWAVFEDNDPSRRVMMIINYNFDLSEYWEFASEGRQFFGITEAFKLGINYMMYTLTH